jgi:hypothetical protein
MLLLLAIGATSYFLWFFPLVFFADDVRWVVLGLLMTIGGLAVFFGIIAGPDVVGSASNSLKKRSNLWDLYRTVTLFLIVVLPLVSMAILGFEVGGVLSFLSAINTIALIVLFYLFLIVWSIAHDELIPKSSEETTR